MSSKKTRIMYIEDKSAGLNGPARIGRVTLSKSGRSIHYGSRLFQRLGGDGFKANYFDAETGDHYWISGPRKDGCDRLYPSSSTRSKSTRMFATSIGRRLEAVPPRDHMALP